MSRETRFRPFRVFLIASVSALALSACASNRSANSPTADYSGLSAQQTQATLAELSARYAANPRDKGTIINFAAALRAAGQTGQAVSVLQRTVPAYPNDPDIQLAYAKALAADGKFNEAMNIVDRVIQPDRPSWNALLVKGAILDQMGQNEAARQLYQQALMIAPNNASIEANLGLSYAMTNDLGQAEQHLKRAQSMNGASSQVRQNLALVIGLQGRFDEAKAIYAQSLPPDQVEANMAYIRALLTQQGRWDTIKKAG